MVRKFLVILLLGSSITPAYGMWIGLARSAGSLARVASARVAAVSARDLQNCSWLNDTWKVFPKELKCASPLVGAAMLEGSMGKQWYEMNNPRGRLAKHLLHRYNDEDLRVTDQEGNPFCSIDPHTAGALALAISNGTVDSFLESDVVVAWHKKHVEKTGRFVKSGIKSFRKQIKRSLSFAQDMNQEDIIATLSMVGCIKSWDGQDLKAYCAGLGVELEPSKISLTELGQEQDCKDIDVEQLTVRIIKAIKSDYSFLAPPAQLHVYSKKERVAICVEQALWGFLNIVLYNTQTKKLDLSLLPSHITVAPALKAFIEKYSNVQDDRYYEMAKDAFTEVVWGIRGIDYIENGYELDDGIPNSVKVLNYLLGTKVKTIAECGQQLSTSQRTITVSEHPQKYQTVSVEVCDESQNYEIAAAWLFKYEHGNLTLKSHDKKFTDRTLRALMVCQHANPELPLAQLLQDKFTELARNLIPLKIFKDNSNAQLFEDIISLPSFNPNQSVEDGFTLLRTAIMHNNVDAVRLLLKHGVKVDIGIAYAVLRDNLAMAEILFQSQVEL